MEHEVRSGVERHGGWCLRCVLACSQTAQLAARHIPSPRLRDAAVRGRRAWRGDAAATAASRRARDRSVF